MGVIALSFENSLRLGASLILTLTNTSYFLKTVSALLFSFPLIL